MRRTFTADTAYYFITVGESEGKRMATAPDLGSGFPEISSYTHYLYHELDRVNILSSGREWYGQFISASNRVRIEFENLSQDTKWNRYGAGRRCRQ